MRNRLFLLTVLSLACALLYLSSLTAQNSDVNSKDLASKPATGSVNLLEATSANTQLKTAKIKGEVKVAISKASKQASTTPELAIQDIKEMITIVQNESFLIEADRLELLNALNSCARYLDREKFAKEIRFRNAKQNSEKLDEIDLRRKEQAAQEEQEFAQKKRRFDIRRNGEYFPSDSTNSQQAENQKWLAQSPFAVYDDQPLVVYPKSWLKLSEARKKKYSDVVDTQTESHKNLINVLDKPIEIGEGVQLSDWINEVKRKFGISIIFDGLACNNNNIQLNQTMVVTGKTSLRTVLNLILSNYDLVACVRGNSIFITTKETMEALEPSDDLWCDNFDLRYYPSSDLTVFPNVY